ncbi:hypothetical protein CHLRE_07g325745v5 [Chlamydomonas reinhardtii]|uniref:Uncharacterized protein n=1 Tax=Chlamydomonas reinhardtii TaxID=3055 RepID=A0A2K3DJH4_CHLRE|nr:uncharacterized protein CHLRE_07g325745v5 [Chlamydomonas reinhardtii]PNW80671.1 hypothetical protein CHLRE_07g325745v5 [Chlamydomonas reinhardtii]
MPMASATASSSSLQRGSRLPSRQQSPAAAAAAGSVAGAKATASLLLCVVLLGTCGLGRAAPAGAAADDTRCRGALKLQTDPAVQAFKKCADKTPIPIDCCLKMIPFAPYADCLQLPTYKSMADSFLAPTVTVDRALRECLG